MIFYLGTHETSWLATAGVPLFVSARRLRRRVALPRAAAPWALDSGGFSELGMHGGWATPPSQYAAEARRWMAGVGNLQWAAPQDWMCEPAMVARTGLSVEEHQRRTVASLLALRRVATDVPWVPVLQGYRIPEYLRCLDMHGEAGIDLRAEPTVGLGSVCRREATSEIEELVYALHGAGLHSLHGFGVKSGGLRRVGHLLASSDSLAWSAAARRDRRPLPGCRHKNCANCILYAMQWRRRVLDAVPAGGQLPAPFAA